MDGAETGLVEVVVDVVGEVVADGFGRDGDAGGPLADEIGDVGEAVIAGEIEVVDELGGGGGGEGLGARGPDGGDPGEAGAGVPLVGEVDGDAGADGGFDVGVVLAGEEGGVADEEGGVGAVEHGDGVGGVGRKTAMVAVEAAEEELCVGGGGAGGGVGGDGAEVGEGVGMFDEEEDGADVVGEAMVQPGTIARDGARAAMGIRPRSASPLSSWSAQREGRVWWRW